MSTRDLRGLLQSVAGRLGIRGTFLDPNVRAAHPVALAEHFHYPRTADILPRYAQNLAAAVVGGRKLIVRREGTFAFDLLRDPDELTPEPVTVSAFAELCRRDGVSAAAVATARAHLERWERAAEAA